jgi:hypothetical protein
MSNTPSNNQPSASGKFLDEATWQALKAAGFTDEQLYADQPFGPIVAAYTRKQAIADGVLVDMTGPGFGRLLAKFGIKVHAAMTHTCFVTVIVKQLTPDNTWEALAGFADVLIAFRKAVFKSPLTNVVHFTVDGTDGKPAAMWAHIGPGDEGEPVLTFMLEGED